MRNREIPASKRAARLSVDRRTREGNATERLIQVIPARQTKVRAHRERFRQRKQRRLEEREEEVHHREKALAPAKRPGP
jgi:hypothetical protein